MAHFIRHRNLVFILFFTIIFSNNILFAINFQSIEDVSTLHLKYKFGFWLTGEAAIGDLSVKKISGDRFKAVLVAETQGAIGFFANYRKDVMISEMVYSEKEKRFIPEKFIKKIIIGKNYKKSVYIFDYKNKRIIKKKEKVTIIQENDSPEKDFMSNIDEDSSPKKIIKHSISYIPLKHKRVDDYLTASLNFFTGAYGFPGDNSSISIRLFPEKSKKKRNRIIRVDFDKLEKNLFKLEVNLNVDFISDKIKKAFVFMDANMIPEKVDILTSTIIGTIRAERIKLGKK